MAVMEGRHNDAPDRPAAGPAKPKPEETRLQALTALVEGGELRRLSGHDARLLLALMRYADYSTRECYPSTITLAAQTGMSRRVVQRTLANLETKGIIKTVELGGGRGKPTARKILTTMEMVAGADAVSKPTKGVSGKHANSVSGKRKRASAVNGKGVSAGHQNYSGNNLVEQITPNSRNGMNGAALDEGESDVQGLVERHLARNEQRLCQRQARRPRR